MMEEITVYGKAGGKLEEYTAMELGTMAIQKVLRGTDGKVKPEDLDYVIMMGQVVQQNDDNSNPGKDTGIFESPDFRFGKDTEIILSSGISSFGSRSQSLGLSIPISFPDNLQIKTRKLPDDICFEKSL